MASTSGIVFTQGKKWFEKFARFGIASKGVVYCLMGLLAFLTVFGLRSVKPDKAEAMQVVYQQPFGKILLAVIGIGLLGYVALRFLQAFLDLQQKGSDLGGLVTRTGFAISAVLYLGLSVYALRLSIMHHADGESKQFIVGKVMTYPGGEWIIAITAVIIIISGIYQIYKGLSGRFMKNVRLYRSSYAGIFRKAGVMGYVARGIVFCVLGYFLVTAALHSNPKEARGSDAAFNFLQDNFGTELMGAVAVGLFAYGIFMFVKARYEDIGNLSVSLHA